MVGPRSRNLWVIWVSFALALLLSVAPMPAFMETGRPLWLALFLTAWTLALPHRVGMTTAWVLGLAADVLYGTLLGQNALILTFITFLVLSLHQRLRMFPMWQQSLVLLVVFGLAQLVQLWLNALRWSVRCCGLGSTPRCGSSASAWVSTKQRAPRLNRERFI